MATSNSTNFTVTRDDIIKRALRLLGVVAQGETPTTDQVTEAAFALNMLAKAWQADGMPLWAIKQTSITLVNGQREYVMGIGQAIDIPKPLKIYEAFNRSSTSNVDIPMRPLTKQEYNLLGNKSSSGNPIQFYYDPQRVSGTLSVFPVPTTVEAAANTIVITYQRPFEDFDSATDEPDFPQEWFDALSYGLACRLAPEYGIPPTDRKTLWQEMSLIKQDALNFGLENGSMFFEVDRRSY
jgi:hypothetical protein